MLSVCLSVRHPRMYAHLRHARSLAHELVRAERSLTGEAAGLRSARNDAGILRRESAWCSVCAL